MLKPLAHRERGRPSGASVLVVDDNPQVRDVLRALLGGRGDRPLAVGDEPCTLIDFTGKKRYAKPD